MKKAIRAFHLIFVHSKSIEFLKFNCQSTCITYLLTFEKEQKQFHNMTDESNFVKEIDNNKNKNSVRCQFCDSLLLKARSVNGYSENAVCLNLINF